MDYTGRVQRKSSARKVTYLSTIPPFGGLTSQRFMPPFEAANFMFCMTLLLSGCNGGIGKGIDTKSGAGGGGGHGGGGGSGVLDEIKTQGGIAYGSVKLPCELGSGGGIAGYGNATAGGGMIGEPYYIHVRPIFVWFKVHLIYISILGERNENKLHQSWLIFIQYLPCLESCDACLEVMVWRFE